MKDQTASQGTEWAVRVDRAVALSKYAWRQFGSDQCLQSAGLLTYTTLLSLVPLLIVMLSTASALSGADQWNEQIQSFLFKYFLPEAQETISGKLESLTVSRGGVTATMAVFLVLTSLILMSNIENALNRIWGVQTARSLSSKFVVYWSMLTLGPVLLGASLALSSYFTLDALLSEQQIGLVRGITQTLMPYAVGSLAFFLLFMIVPNRKVPWRHALTGALLTAIMFEFAKKGFGLYLHTFDSYTVLYGALGSIPIFLIWTYLSWSIILLGASLTASFDSFRYQVPGHGWPAKSEFVLLYRLVGHLWQAQKTGRGVSVNELLDCEPRADDHQLQRLLENLRQAAIISREDDGDWVLVRDLAEISVADLYQTGAFVWPMDSAFLDDQDEWGRALASAVQGASQPLGSILDRPLKLFYSGAGPDDHQPPDRARSAEK
jgi:membrane protein